MAQAATVEQLRARICAIEASTRQVRAASPTVLDDVLPWRLLSLGCLHEVVGVAGDPCGAVGFLTAFLARLPNSRAPVLWCQRAESDREYGGLYAPGLRQFGFDPERLVLARAKNTTGVLWALEEGLRQPGLAAVVGEVEEAGFTESRRLQLAAEASGVTALLLCPRRAAPATAAALWSIESLPTPPSATGLWTRGPCWRVNLIRCRGGAPGGWTMEWRNATGDFIVAADLCDGSVEPQRTQMAG